MTGEKFPNGLLKFYTPEKLMKVFGTVTPTLNERTDYFDGLWFLFGEENEINVLSLLVPKEYSRTDFVSKLRKEYGPFNVVRRGFRMRFRSQEDAVLVKLKYSK